jgi:acyl-CoA synthetase (AMP-forming)/AMP-acid ligase II
MTLGALLERRAEQHPHHGFTFLDPHAAPSRLDYEVLGERARAIAAVLAATAPPGARVLLLFAPGLPFIEAFSGVVVAGLVAVPTYPPTSSIELWARRVDHVLSDCRPEVVFTTSDLLDLREVGPELSALPWIAIDTIDARQGGRWRPARVRSNDTALIQYTSGSTGAPKGVELSHQCLLANQRVLAEAFRLHADSVVVSWLPMYHDMGLLGCVLNPIHQGCDAVLMSPITFLEQPGAWLRAFHDYRGTCGGAPNFAYDVCSRRVSKEERAALDLSSWEIAFCGAEPIRAETLQRFAERFEPCGFRADALLPCYGLAESSLFVTGVPLGVTPRVKTTRLDPSQPPVVSVGRPTEGHVVRIVDPETREPVPDGACGEIWIQGPSVARGYWGRDSGTDGVFDAMTASGEGPYLRSGDLGMAIDGDLYVTGRIKEVLILNGRNIYPTDIESAAQESDQRLRPGCGAAFSMVWDGAEGAVLVQEVRESADSLDEVSTRIRSTVASRAGVVLRELALVPPRTVPKTTSGKLQRLECRLRYTSGQLPVTHLWRASRSEATP